ncbi:MFS transporter [Sphingosinicella sp. GR2756]|uniref:MFS transporter n=2 Tax=Sphingosinicella rhizophila TaxID=3050082 RepID=A0ABU3Q4Q5_9SPHN|nr:MFS transporter [Sphingosinicella sp. GR2756]MDT9598400.1 MFS transporter [Sphingosinicella sp. GR2756]
MASNFGGLIQSVGASWMMTSIAGSAEMITLVQASVTLPIMLLSLVAGALADNFDRRRMMLAAQVFMLFVSVALAACAWTGLITPWLLLAFTFMIGCGTAFNGPAWQASVGDMVERPDLPGAIALNSMGFNIARSLGPAIGGAIVAAAGAAAAFAVNAASYVGLIAVLARWRPDHAPQPLPRETLGVAMAAGIRYAAMSPAIRTVLGRSAIFGIGASAIPALMPLIARDVIAGGPLTYGLLLGSFGFGAVAGALASARLRSAFSSETLARGSCLAFAAAAALAGLSPWLPATMAVLLVAGVAWVLVLSTFNVTVQLHSPRWVVARALSLYQMAAFGGMAGGSWLWGVIAEDHGIWAALAVAATVLLGCALLGLRLPLPARSDIDLDPLRSWQAPETAVAVEPRSGPVVITIEYRIRPEDRRPFLATMAERRRIRRRDGARHWTLLRDLADAEIWIERFHLPTWLEYARHNNRVTKADAVVTERLRALHCGKKAPIIRRMIERQTGSIPDSRTPSPRELAEPLTDPNASS